MSPTRDVQLALIEGHERNVGPVPGSVFTGRQNADLIATYAPLYLTGSVLDVTYGEGLWWRRFTPNPFTFHDLKIDGVDFRDLPHPDRSFDTVCFDPPYVPAGGVRSTGQTEAERRFRDSFGLEPRSLAELNALNLAGLAECARVFDRFLLVKCMDFVTGGAFTLGHKTMLDRAQELGLVCWDIIVHAAGTGPGGHNITDILRARRAHSYLLVFARDPYSVPCIASREGDDA